MKFKEKNLSTSEYQPEETQKKNQKNAFIDIKLKDLLTINITNEKNPSDVIVFEKAKLVRTISFSPRSNKIKLSEIDPNVYRSEKLSSKCLQIIKNVHHAQIFPAFRYFINLDSFADYFKLNGKPITRDLECEEKERPRNFVAWLVEEFEEFMKVKPLITTLNQALLILNEKTNKKFLTNIKTLLVFKSMTFNSFGPAEIHLRKKLYPQMFCDQSQVLNLNPLFNQNFYLKKLSEDTTTFIININPNNKFNVTHCRIYRIFKKEIITENKEDKMEGAMGSMEVKLMIKGNWKKNKLYSAELFSSNLQFTEKANWSDKIDIQRMLLPK